MSVSLSTALRNAMMDGGSGKGFKGALEDGIIEVFTAPRPANADAAETGTKLLRITVASGAFVAGTGTNGLSLGTPSGGAVAKASEVWSGVGLANGVANWYRYYSNAALTGAETAFDHTATKVRMDGSCATSGSQLNMSNTNVVLNATTTIDSASFSLPAS